MRSRGRQDYAVTSKRSSLVTVADPFNTGPGESKAFSNRHSIDMVSVLHGVREAKCLGTASNSIPNSEQTQFEFTQVMRASEMSYLVDTPDYYQPPSSYPQFKDQAPSEDDVIVVSEKFRHVFYGYDGTEFAGMASCGFIRIVGCRLWRNYYTHSIIEQHDRCQAKNCDNTISNGRCYDEIISCWHNDLFCL